MNHEPIPGTHEAGYVEQPIVQQSLPPQLRHAFDNDPTRAKGTNVSLFKMGECTIMLAREPAGAGGARLWHLSISHPLRHPTWDEIKTARYRMLDPDLTFGMLLPPRDKYVNIAAQDHVFHLWEVRDERRA